MHGRLLLFTVALVVGSPPHCPGGGDAELTVLGENYPQAFFFRACEGPPSLPGTRYEAWDADFSRLMGIMGKCLDEEVLGRERRNPEFFRRFKREHPEQAVLLHFNGNSRDPRHGTEAYFPGHWIYRRATKILADVAPQEGESDIRVEDASDFQVGGGRYKTSNDDIALFAIAADGRHDWSRCEQVQLIAVNKKSNSIRVRRGCYGTRPIGFRAGAARAAAHAVEGPWGKNNNLLWYYNFSTHSPRDGQGKSCADRLTDDLAAWFGKGGKLEGFDGLEFDVMFNETRGDTDGDGIADDGRIGGVNAYGVGMIEFARQLRTRLGERRLILGDGALGQGGRRSQRAVQILNGIESEGFPNLDDWDFRDWSGGLNRHAFWKANGRAPAFSYINHKWIEPIPGRPGEHGQPDVPFGRHRLSFAAAQFTDAAICYSFPPPREGGKFGIWDELRCGVDGRIGWLGRPEGPAVHMAAQKPDLLGGGGTAFLARHIRGPVNVGATNSGVVIAPNAKDASDVRCTISGIPADGSDIVVLLTMHGEPMAGYPRESARFVECELSGGATSLMGDAPDVVGMALRAAGESPIERNSGAAVRNRTGVAIAGRKLPAYGVHPPYQNGRGYVFWCHDTVVPPDSELRFCLGMSDKAPARSDGIWFRVLIAEVLDGRAGNFKQIFERDTRAYEWIPCAVPLGAYAGKHVRLKFVADCGPADNATTDQGYWADVKMVKAGIAEDQIMVPSTSMTWVSDRPFTSSFYFKDVRPGPLDLGLFVEGSGRIVISGLTVHAHSDAMFRVFQNGIVLANPSQAPRTFDLEQISPGRRYRRIKGTPSQDSQANSGQPVAGAVTIGERDALFLVRER